MDCFHREPLSDTRTGRDCAFCQQIDQDFARRKPLDRFVKDCDTAAGHVTEEGYLRHRIMELKILKVKSDLSLWHF